MNDVNQKVTEEVKRQLSKGGFCGNCLAQLQGVVTYYEWTKEEFKRNLK